MTARYERRFKTKASSSSFTVCGLTFCEEKVLAHDIPLCAEHWKATPDEERRAYCNPPWIESAGFIAWAESYFAEQT